MCVDLRFFSLENYLLCNKWVVNKLRGKNVQEHFQMGHCWSFLSLMTFSIYFNHGNIEGTTYLLTMQVHAGCKKVQAKSDRHSYIHDCMRFT